MILDNENNWSVNITDEEVPEIVEELCRRTSFSRSKIITRMLKTYGPALLKSDKALAAFAFEK